MAAIYNHQTNDVISAGLQGCDVCDETILAAQQVTDNTGKDVELVDDNGRWLVHPAIWSGGEHGNPVRKHREPADFLGEVTILSINPDGIEVTEHTEPEERRKFIHDYISTHDPRPILAWMQDHGEIQMPETLSVFLRRQAE